MFKRMIFMVTIKEGTFKETKQLVEKFGASPLSELKDLPDYYTFNKNLLYSHRDFPRYLKALNSGKKCAIVSGINPSGGMHFGHRIVFDTNLFFQENYGVDVFIPLSDDESYITGKVDKQETALKNALTVAKELLAYGFNPKKTFVIIDQIYTSIYNLAIKFSRGITMSAIKATYGYKMEDNPGLFFYPAIQTAHILLPLARFDYDDVLVAIGPDEDSHIRIGRDIAPKFGLKKPAIVHAVFLPGLTGEKMSASKPETAIFFEDKLKDIDKKVMKSYSGGRVSVEEHRKFGGDPDNDISCLYLSFFFLDDKESEKLFEDYRKGRLLSGEVKKMFSKRIVKYISDFQKRKAKIQDKDVEMIILRNN
jgi:tryptophanyl-tRNA synthetase